MAFIAFDGHEDKRYGLSLLQANLQEKYTLSLLGIQYSYLPIHLSKELNQIKAQGLYKDNAFLQKEFIRQFHHYAKQYNGLTEYKQQCEHLLQETHINGMLKFMEASPFYKSLQEQMKYLLAGKEFAHFPSASLIGLYERLLNLQDYLLAAQAQLKEKFQNSQKWYYFWQAKMPKEVHREISKALQKELNTIDQYKNAYTKTIFLRLMEGASHQDPQRGDVLDGSLSMLAEAGLYPCKRLSLPRQDINPALFSKFLEHIFKYGSKLDIQKIKGQFWFRADPQLAIPIHWSSHAYPIPARLQSLVPSVRKTPVWLSYDHNACCDFFKDSAFFIAQINGAVEKARFSVQFGSIDVQNLLQSPALNDVKKCNALLDWEIQRLETLKPSLWKRIFYLKTYALISAWQQDLKQVKRQKITEFLCVYCDSLSVELANTSEPLEARVTQQLNSLLRHLEPAVEYTPSLKIQFENCKQKICQLLNPPLAIEHYRESLPFIRHALYHHDHPSNVANTSPHTVAKPIDTTTYSRQFMHH
jgi:hypothetical protein